MWIYFSSKWISGNSLVSEQDGSFKMEWALLDRKQEGEMAQCSNCGKTKRELKGGQGIGVCLVCNRQFCSNCCKRDFWGNPKCPLCGKDLKKIA